MRYPMKCPDCGYEVTSQDVPIEAGPPTMMCLKCAVWESRWVAMRRVFSAVPAIFRGGGWASKS